MPEISRKIQEINGLSPDQLRLDDLLKAGEPVVLRGVAAKFPLVQKVRSSNDEAIEYLKSFDSGQPVLVYSGAPDIKGRFFYEQDLERLNFTTEWRSLTEYLDGIVAEMHKESPASLFVGSLDLDRYLPGFREENQIRQVDSKLAQFNPLVSMWTGNQTITAAHFDMSNNLTTCLAGRRRFTLFPPEQVKNLYPGPFEITPGGQVISMVDFRDPDFDKYPRFREALASAQTAELEPGDMLFFPAHWWHHVEGLEPFNVTINYWWNPSPAFMDTPMNTLLHGILSLRDRPEEEKRAWKELFEYYVFGPSTKAGEHLPESARGILGPMDDLKARRLRSQLLKRLNR